MKIDDITFGEYMNCSVEDLFFYNELMILKSARQNQIQEVDCKNWKWGDVKWCQDAFINDMDFESMLKIVNFECKNKLTLSSSARLVLAYFHSIRESIESITQIEAEALAYQQTPKEMAASDAVGGFGKFGTLPQTLSMVGVVAQSIKEVEDYDWGTVFNAMVFKHTEGQYQKHLYKA